MFGAGLRGPNGDAVGMRPTKTEQVCVDSLLEEARFEPSVPPGLAQLSRLMHAKRCDEIVRANSGAAAVQLDLCFAASHSIDPGWGTVWVGCGWLRCLAASNSWRASSKMPQPAICGLSISRAPLQASTSSSCARSGKPSI